MIKYVFSTLSTDGAEQEQVFNEGNNIRSCIDQMNCLDNEICVKHDNDDGLCQCSLGYKRNIAGAFYSIINKLRIIRISKLTYIFRYLYNDGRNRGC
jgi:intergrase/recombinase